MTISQGDVDRLRHEVVASLHKHWVFYLVEGIILICLGAADVIIPAIAPLAVTIFLGWLFLISGLVGLFNTMRTRGVPGFWWSLLSAILAIAVGAIMIGRPISGAFSLTLLLIAFFLIEGLVSIMFALDHRRYLAGAWGWMLASGIVDLLIVGVVFAELPGSGLWLLGTLLGINLIIGGIALVAMALQARRIDPGVPAAI